MQDNEVRITEVSKDSGYTGAEIYGRPYSNPADAVWVKTVPFNFVYKYFSTQEVGQYTWYNVGKDEWIREDWVSKRVSDVTRKKGVVRVASWINPNNIEVRFSPNGKINFNQNKTNFQPGSEWAYNETVVDDWGLRWYDLGTAQWVSAQQVKDTAEGGWQFPFNNKYLGYNPQTEDGTQFGITGFNRGNYKPNPYFHDGFDFGNVRYGSGSTFNAVHEGDIIFAGPRYDQGLKMVILEDIGDALVIYQEFSDSLNDILVSAGTHVTAGQPIGRLGSYHMHLGISKEKQFNQALAYSFDPNAGIWYSPIATIQNQKLTF
ncbi:hypothetical protein FC83_GL002958 [Agrilactobacillus composti DSM 18527 = JCM 14202]|uniref:M23ase beta-sheet core domain-containing protein n=1 Tax=Agrilactobacillus composti DSM 18527 = JCM 14202 TaxID=1423734 RepID=X0PUI6_9LACO|nr:M23 family metallopeptidase [Agrilactobacillus composti]KRM33389.1 hypothetical protein FC83_GL002958 [Agrilactobacillus composti DSM 18527 = JCM 14202]GAF41772.1 enterolysin A [Agrilactobacillus composti DSM 18527 = JCM 14202]